LQEGRIQRANAYLDHHYMIIGKLSSGNVELKQNSVNALLLDIEEECKLIPPDGVYAVRIEVGKNSFKGILNVKNSRYGNDRCKEEIIIELVPFEIQDSIEGKDSTVYFAKYIRQEIEFKGVDELKIQLGKDRVLVEELIY
jgi:riboflavin kinase/FMN adenylyltransferase